MHTEELLALYVGSHDLERGTVVWFNCAIARWSRHLGRLPLGADYNDATFNAWLTAELKGHLSRQTISGYRRAILMLWRWGWREGHLKDAPRNPKQVKAPLPVPVGLSASDIDRMLSAAAKTEGCFRRNGISKAAFYRALILLVWDAGVRLSDALRMTWQDLEQGAITQKKTGYPKQFRVSAATLAAINAVRIEGERRILGGVLSKRHVIVGMKYLRIDAGLSIGGTKAIRKGGASAVEAVSRGAAKDYLGHRTSGLAERHYLDPRIVNREPPTPPPLTGAG